MKLGEAIPNYQAHRNELQDKKTSIKLFATNNSEKKEDIFPFPPGYLSGE